MASLQGDVALRRRTSNLHASKSHIRIDGAGTGDFDAVGLIVHSADKVFSICS